MSDSTHALPYATPSPRQPRTWVQYIGWRTLAASYVLVLPALIACLLIVPHFESIFLDFNTRLPWLTQVVLEVSRWVRTDFGWLYLLLLPMLLAVAVGAIGSALRPQASAPASTERRLLGWGWAVLLTGFLLMALVAIFVLAMFLPMVSLIESASGP